MANMKNRRNSSDRQINSQLWLPAPYLAHGNSRRDNLLSVT